MLQSRSFATARGSPYRCARAVAAASHRARASEEFDDEAMEEDEAVEEEQELYAAERYEDWHEEFGDWQEEEEEEQEPLALALSTAWQFGRQQLPAPVVKLHSSKFSSRQFSPERSQSPGSRATLPQSPEPEPEQPCCRRCSGRQEAARSRLGLQAPPHMALELNRQVPIPPPSRPPKSTASHAPRPRASIRGQIEIVSPAQRGTEPALASTASSSRSRSASRGLLGPDRNEHLRHSQPALAAPLEEFSERLWGFVRTCLGLHHPHQDRLKAALDQQVEALGNGFTAVLSLSTAFAALRSSARESGLWQKLREYRERLFKCNAELKEARALASKEAALRRAMGEASSLAQHQAKAARGKAVALLCGGPAASEVLMLSCLSSWRRLASMDAAARLSAMKALAMAFGSANSVKTRASFVAWKSEARSSVEKRRAEEVGAGESQAAQLLLSRAKAATASVVMAASSRAERQLLATHFAAWWRYAMKSQCQDLKTRAETAEYMAMQKANIIQKMSLSSRFGRSLRQLGQVTLLRWAREASNSARRRHVREAAVKSATFTSELLGQRRCQGLLGSCLGGWAEATPKPRREAPSLGWSYASCGSKVPAPDPRAAPVLRGASAPLKTSASQTEPSAPKKEEGDAQSWLQQQKLHPPMPWEDKKQRPQSAAVVRTEPKQQVAAEPTSVPDLEQDKSMQEAVRHWCLATQASVSEEGYKQLLEYHRQKAKQDRRAGR